LKILNPPIEDKYSPRFGLLCRKWSTKPEGQAARRDGKARDSHQSATIWGYIAFFWFCSLILLPSFPQEEARKRKAAESKLQEEAAKRAAAESKLSAAEMKKGDAEARAKEAEIRRVEVEKQLKAEQVRAY
jgi:hypothetical protein